MKVAPFPSSATIEAVETALQAVPASSHSLILDFSKSVFIEVATLQFVVALVAQRTRASLTTRMKLPSGEEGFPARSFMRRWSFPAALKSATNLRFDAFVVESDLEYFQGKGGDAGPGLYAQKEETYKLPSGDVTFTVDAHRFFEFCTWDITKYRDPKRLVMDACATWNVKPVMAALARNLRRPGNSRQGGMADVYLTSRVFYEAMTNAVRHPGANLIQVVSHLDAQGTKKQHFTIVFWDDGKSMLHTLAAALEARKPIRRPSPSDFETHYQLTRVGDTDGAESVEFLSSRETPDSSQDEMRLLLATLFPGTTSSVSGEDHSASPDLVAADARLGEPGMGLFVLVSTAIDMFGGSVAFRTDRYFMNIKASSRAKQAAAYAVKIRRYPAAVPSFLGNMVTVRLPLVRNDA